MVLVVLARGEFKGLSLVRFTVLSKKKKKRSTFIFQNKINSNKNKQTQNFVFLEEIVKDLLSSPLFFII